MIGMNAAQTTNGATSTAQSFSPTEHFDARALLAQYETVRQATEDLCRPLAIDDYAVQSMPDASPTKWHLAHTTWFFETFVLAPFLPGYRAFDEHFTYLFNSYYNTVGKQWPRPQRGMLSRPTVNEVYRYRWHVDDFMHRLFIRNQLSQAAMQRIELGLHHEQQHQELIITDLKHAWSFNPLRPVYAENVVEPGTPPRAAWLSFPEGAAFIGHGGNGFAFDNETPRHRVWRNGFCLSNRLVTNHEYLTFMQAGGYTKPEYWLSDGWASCREHGWNAPLYWEADGAQWFQITLSGRRPVIGEEPVCHISYYEADAFARWAGARLPTEAEWETAADLSPMAGHFAEAGLFHPLPAPAADDKGPIYQLFGDVWQWTSSPYVAYPGFRSAEGALGEYNGKFMCNQLVLRGASCATPKSHARRTYRNFFPPEARWQFSGIRLAKDAV